MKKLLTVSFISLISISCAWGTPIDSLLRVFDATLINRHLYEKKAKDPITASPFATIMRLIEYGFTADATEALDAIPFNKLSETEKADYYRCRVRLNDYLYRRHRTDTLGYKHSERMEKFQDSLFALLPQEGGERMYYEAMFSLRRQEYRTAHGKFEEAAKACADHPQLLMEVYGKMAEVDERSGHRESAEGYRIRRAILGIKHAVEDYSGLIDVAEIRMRRGEIEQARRYLDEAQQSALTVPSPLLALRLNRALTELRKADAEKQVTEKHRLYFFFSVLSVMAVLLLFSIRKINKQMHIITQNKEKVEELYADLEKKNAALEKVNAGLTDLTQQLQVTNSQLSEVSLLKEEYIGHFLKQCSEYLHKLQDYKKMANRKIQAGQIDELFKLNASNRMAQEESKELYRKFDIAFLKIFPHFVEQFNELLTPDERFILGKDELLNTELRLFALIRLGIKDSSQIADFLGYSVTTIYTYRTRIKNKSMGNREEFEANVMKIGM